MKKTDIYVFNYWECLVKYFLKLHNGQWTLKDMLLIVSVTSNKHLS